MRTLMSFFILLIFSIMLNAQGKIYPAFEADQLFGGVTDSKEVSISVLKDCLTKTDKAIMFNIVDDHLIVADQHKASLYLSGEIKSNIPKLGWFSKNIVEELLTSYDGETATVQLRTSGTLTINYGAQTLELALWCPPNCP